MQKTEKEILIVGLGAGAIALYFIFRHPKTSVVYGASATPPSTSTSTPTSNASDHPQATSGNAAKPEPKTNLANNSGIMHSISSAFSGPKSNHPSKCQNLQANKYAASLPYFGGSGTTNSATISQPAINDGFSGSDYSQTGYWAIN